MGARLNRQAIRWRDYVESIVDGAPGIEISRRTGIDPGTISRWLNPKAGADTAVTASSARKFADGYRRSIAEAFVHAGLLTQDEIGVPIPAIRPYSARPTDELMEDLRAIVAELTRRLSPSTSNGTPGT